MISAGDFKLANVNSQDSLCPRGSDQTTPGADELKEGGEKSLSMKREKSLIEQSITRARTRSTQN